MAYSMASLDIATFAGMIPRRGPRLLEPFYGTAAHNIWARTGYLAPRAQDEILSAAGEGGTNYVYRWVKRGEDDLYLQFDSPDLSVVRSPLSNDTHERIYWAGDDIVPMFNTHERVKDSDPAYVLGVPRLVTRPTLTIDQTGVGAAETRYYVVTYVDIYGHESAPTNPAKIVTKVDATIEVDFNERAGYDITRAPLDKVRIYRTISGSATTAFFFVGETDVDNSPYEDAEDPDDVALNELLSSDNYFDPPALEGFVAMPGGFLAGWIKRDIYFSQPYLPHAWPTEFTLSVEHDIVGLGSFDQNLAILTKGGVYLASGIAPDGMSLQRLGPSNPCRSRRSIVSIPNGVLYASDDGLALVDLTGTRIITRDIITREQWSEDFFATDMRAALDGDAVYAAIIDDNQGYEIDFREPARGLVKFNLPVGTNAFNTDEFGPRPLTIYDGNIYAVAAGVEALTYTWKSKEFFMSRPLNFGAMHIEVTDDGRGWDFTATGTIKIYSDGVLSYDEDIVPNTPVKLPSGFKAETWQFEITGAYTVARLMIAETEKELAEL